MRKLPAIALAGFAAAALAGTAVAASRSSHVINVALPDGSTARVEYVGDVAPKVTIEPGRPVAFGALAPLPSFASFDQMFEQMNRETEAMMRQAQQMQQVAAQAGPGGAAPTVASFGNAPAGVTSTAVVSYSNGHGTCTRTTQTVSQGAGKPPKVTSSVSGDCGAEAAPPEPRGPLSNT